MLSIPTSCSRYVEVGVTEDAPHCRSDRVFVIDDQYTGFGVASSWLCVHVSSVVLTPQVGEGLRVAPAVQSPAAPFTDGKPHIVKQAHKAGSLWNPQNLDS